MRTSSLAVLLVAALVTSGCAGFWGQPDPEPADGTVQWVEPDLESDDFIVNIVLTDEGPEPKTVFIPAGQHIKMVFRNRGMHEHHYRVVGLVPEDVAWIFVPEIDETELEALTEEELEALGLGGPIDDVEHVLHHILPVFLPFREESLSGIKPLANEVHAYTQRGGVDIITFYATNTGRFQVEDLRYPELTAEVVVFLAEE
jgi:hypothetical protein